MSCSTQCAVMWKHDVTGTGPDISQYNPQYPGAGA